MADGKRAGVSCDQLPNGRYRLRWRETEREDGIERRVQRSFVVSTEAEATLARARILRAMERGELFEREPVRELSKAVTLDAVLAGWVRSRRAKGISPSTYDSHIDAVGRILRTLRALHNIDEGRAVPGELLTRDHVLALTNHLRDQGAPGGDGGLSDGSLYTTVRVLVNAWVWASDDPETYPGLRAAPRDTSDLLPRTAIYAPTEAPSMAEVDAMIRRLAPYRKGATAQAVAVLARCTGLRMGQVMGIMGPDVSLSARTRCSIASDRCLRGRCRPTGTQPRPTLTSREGAPSCLGVAPSGRSPSPSSAPWSVATLPPLPSGCAHLSRSRDALRARHRRERRRATSWKSAAG